MTTATELLQHAASLLAERGKTYDTQNQVQERSMPKIVKLFNSLHGTSLTVQQGWDFMLLLKLVRGAGTNHKDSAEDLIAYAALKAETVHFDTADTL